MRLNSPPLLVSTDDYNELVQSALFGGGSRRVSALLTAELLRAVLRRAEDVPDDVVVLGSLVTYRTSRGGEAVTRRLVGPDARPGEDELSVLTLLGVGLIGLRKGNRMRIPRPGGGAFWIVVLDVRPPETAGLAEASAPSADRDEDVRPPSRHLVPAAAVSKGR